jgi:hypothetical protein
VLTGEFFQIDTSMPTIQVKTKLEKISENLVKMYHKVIMPDTAYVLFESHLWRQLEDKE